MVEHVRFDELFDARPGGQITPRRRVRLGGTELGPGASFGPDVKFNGIDITVWLGGLVWGHEEAGVFVIERFSKP